MEREIFIGGEKRQLPCTSIHRYGDSGVADNSVVYNFDCGILDVRIHILKDSEEGKFFKDWIENEENQNRESVEKKAIEYVLPFLTADDFLAIIQRERSDASKKGYKKAQSDIRFALGFEDLW